MRKTLIFYFFDLLMVFASFIIVYFFKVDYVLDNIIALYPQFLLFISIWILGSIAFQKFTVHKQKPLYLHILSIIKANIFILGIILILMFGLRYLHLSRLMVFGTVIGSTTFEIIIISIYYYIKTSKELEFQEIETIEASIPHVEEIYIPQTHGIFIPTAKLLEKKNYIIEEANEKVLSLIQEYINLYQSDNLIISTTTRFNLLNLNDLSNHAIVNLKRINDIRYINKFFEAVNVKLKFEGIFICCVETKEIRKKRFFRKFPPILNLIFYFFDFIVKRIFPKFQLTKKLYFFLTRGQNRVLSKAETLGRLYSCGFKVITEKKIDGYYYIVSQKVKEPVYDPNPTYGPLIKLKRVGKNGKTIYVYKMRTMHPYSEYLQDYVYTKYKLKEGGKFKNDFRITTIGRIMRKFWLDELPMIVNLMKGDLKLIGVRPLSKHYFSLYNSELQQKRIKHKPGLIPPFYADLPKTLDEIQASEFKYLNEYEKHPFKTDLKYFFKAVYNIVFRHKRSS